MEIRKFLETLLPEGTYFSSFLSTESNSYFLQFDDTKIKINFSRHEELIRDFLESKKMDYLFYEKFQEKRFDEIGVIPNVRDKEGKELKTINWPLFTEVSLDELKYFKLLKLDKKEFLKQYLLAQCKLYYITSGVSISLDDDFRVILGGNSAGTSKSIMRHYLRKSDYINKVFTGVTKKSMLIFS